MCQSRLCLYFYLLFPAARRIAVFFDLFILQRDGHPADHPVLHRGDLIIGLVRADAVSYTHLDVYKRQILVRITDYRRPEHAQLYGSDLFVKILLIELLLRANAMYRDYHNITAPTISQNYSLVYNVMNFIHKYYWDDITLDTLSQQFYINKFYLCSLFKSVTGTSPNQYLINCRLMKAKELLLNLSLIHI